MTLAGVEREADEGGLKAIPQLRVIELGSWLAAPQTGALFADHGAEVIKIEPASGDPVRHFPGSMRGGDPMPSAGFALLNRNKKSVVLDLLAPNGMAQLRALLATADVVISNLRPALARKLGVEPAALVADFPRLVVGSITGQGLEGPDADLPGFDVGAFWARSGLLGQITPDGSAPLALTGGYGDLMTGLVLYAAITTGLLERNATGRGGLVETSLFRVGAACLAGDVASQAAYGKAPRPRPREKSRTPLVNCYHTADDRWFFLTAVEAGRHFESLCGAIDREDLLADDRFSSARAIGANAAELIALLDGIFATRPLAHWSARFKESGMWWEKVARPEEVLADEQVEPNGMAHRLAWGDDGAIIVVASPFRVFGHAATQPSTAPALGQHNDEILGALSSGGQTGTADAA